MATIRARIAARSLGPGERLPSIRRLAETLAVSPGTVVEAYDRLAAEGLIVGDNEPYDGHLDGDSIDRHALAPHRPNVLIEVRNDLIAAEDGQIAWADRLAPVLMRVLAESRL